MNTVSTFDVSRYGNLIAANMPSGVTLKFVTNKAPETMYYRSPNLCIVTEAGSRFYLSYDVTMYDLARGAGLTTFDCALPIQWVRAEYLDRGLEFPSGVWCYDAPWRTFGNFVSRGEMLKSIGEWLEKICAAEILHLLDHAHSDDGGNE